MPRGSQNDKKRIWVIIAGGRAKCQAHIYKKKSRLSVLDLTQCSGSDVRGRLQRSEHAAACHGRGRAALLPKQE